MIDEKQFQSSIIKDFKTPTLYVHNCFSSMFSGMLNWISEEFYTRFQYKIITTYDKAVEFFKKKKNSQDGQIQTNILPCVTLDPVLDFSNEEKAGRFLWMFDNLDSNSGKRLFPSINLKDQGVSITPIFTRYQGTVEFTFWFTSIYELMDFRVKLIQYCGGFQRWIRPKFFWTHLILPKELVEFEGPEGKLDWSHTNREIITLQTTNSKEYAYPFQLNSIWRLDSFNDSSTKMGADLISDWKMTATFTWEAMIPTFIHVDNYNYNDIKIISNIGLTSTYAAQPLVTGYNMLVELSKYEALRSWIHKMPIYNIEEDGAAPIVKYDDNQCSSYPTEYQPYNHYVVGKILLIDKLKKPEDIKDYNSILLIENYNEEYKPYLRRCKGAISRYDTSISEFYTFCSGINMSIMCDIKSETLWKTLKKLHNKTVTFDPIGQLIYSGSRNIIKYDNPNMDLNKFVFNNNVLKFIYRNNLENVIDRSNYALNVSTINFTDENVRDKIAKIENVSQKTYQLPYIISDSLLPKIKIYLNDEELDEHLWSIENNLTIEISDEVELRTDDILYLVRTNQSVTKRLTLACNYSMTKTDELNYYTKKKLVSIKLNDDVDISQIYCCSYNGLMTKDIDYIVDSDNREVTFNIEPMRDRIIQIFAFQKYSKN